MKYSHASYAITLLGFAASCSQGSLPSGVVNEAAGSGAQGGTGQTAGGTGGASGGTGAAGGATGATGGTGGTTGGSGGTSGGGTTVGGGAGMTMTVGGATGATAGTGGSAGVGMAVGGGAGTGMAGVGGTEPGAGGTAGGSTTGGAPPIGGAPSAGSGGAGGGGGLTPEEIVPDLQGFYWEGTCSGNPAVTGSSGHNCPMTGTLTSPPAGGINREQTIPVKGTSGQGYTINIEVRGVIGTRCYTGGTRASSAALNENGNNNWWYVGGSYGNPTGWWNTYELHVSPSTGDASGDVYYFNGSGVQGGNDCEREATYLVKYNASFKAKGGGTLTFKIHDENGKGQQNCGSNADGNTTCAPRMVDLTGMAATPPNFTQPPANQLEKTYYPQWMVIAVTSITSP